MAIAMYGTRVEADTYYDDIGLSGTWDLYTNTQKDKALQRATIQIDHLPFLGEKYNYTTQTRAFPRIVYSFRGEIVYDTDTSGNVIVPEAVRYAVYTQAKFLLDNASNSAVQALQAGIVSQSIGSTSETYDKDLLPLDLKTGICREAMELLKPYLLGGA